MGDGILCVGAFLTAISIYNQLRKKLYIINSVGIAYHQNAYFVYHQAEENTHLRCDDIRRTCAAMIYECISRQRRVIHSMICQALSAWIKKSSFRRTRIFWGGRWDSNPRSSVPQTDALGQLRYTHHITVAFATDNYYTIKAQFVNCFLMGFKIKFETLLFCNLELLISLRGFLK